MAKIDSAYAYYASTYANKEVSRYDSHKKSDLRKIYNRIIKTNKESPLYKISNMSEAKKYAIDIKESSKAILNAVDSLSDKYAGSSDSFQKKVAESSNEDAVGVRYVGDGSENKGADGFDIEVRQLAAPQINTGSYLDSKALSFIPGSYSFDINTNASSYEFQFGVSTGETNGEVQDKLKRLINASGLGIEADIVHDDSGKAALQLTSMQTGLSETEDSLFSVAPSANAESISMMKEHLKEIVNISGKDVHTLAADIEMHRREVHERIAREHPELAERFAQRRHLLDKHLKERRPEVYRIIVQLREDNKHK